MVAESGTEFAASPLGAMLGTFEADRASISGYGAVSEASYG